MSNFNTLIDLLMTATDDLKYALTNQEATDERTAELMKLYEDLADTCKEYINAYEYYSYAELYKYSPDEQIDRIRAIRKHFVKK